MIMRYENLNQHPGVFLSMTGLRVSEFDQMYRDILPAYQAAEARRLDRADRQRAVGGGLSPELDARDQILLTVIWLRIYPTNEVLGYLFGVSDSTVSRIIHRVLPVLEQGGRDTMRMPDPGRKRRKQLDNLLTDIPELAVVIDSFEQKVQRPRDPDEQKGHYSGKKKTHTLKSQVAVDEESGRIVDVSESVPGPTPDICLLDRSGLLNRLPEGLAALGDAGYQGIDKRHPRGHSPRKKPRGKDRSPEDVAYNHAFSCRRIIVENTIGRARRYQAITQPDRHHRQHHTARVCAVVGLVNRQIATRLPC